jgi:hypothetical protein
LVHTPAFGYESLAVSRYLQSKNFPTTAKETVLYAFPGTSISYA